MANIPGTAGNDVLNGTNLADTIAGNGGSDQIDGKGGDDVASGDLAEFILSLSSPDAVDTNHPTVTFGYDFGMMSNELKFNDTVYGGDGNDTLYGDSSNIKWSLSAGSVVATDAAGAGSQVYFLEMHQLLGSNVISGGSGDDRLYGNANTLYGDVHSGTAEATGAGVQANSYALAYEIRVIQSGPNTISGGNGNDLIVGNYSIAPGADAPAAAYSGAATASDGGVAGSRADADTIIDTGTGSNTLDGGNGNDTIYGNREVLAGATAFAGEATAAGDFAIADSVANARFSSWEQGSDVISGGNGEDLIVGDVGAMVMRSVSSDASATDNNAFAQSISQVSAATVFNGNDLIHGDKGNDRIYGDSITTSVHAESGDATVSNAPFVRSITQVSESRFRQGNDSLFGDEGDDIILATGKATRCPFRKAPHPETVRFQEPWSSTWEPTRVTIPSPAETVTTR